ncbi:MAG: ATP-binding protein [Motiliproteus sp.]
MKSIKRYLLATLLIAATTVAAVVTYGSYLQTTKEVEELFDAELAQMARVLQSLLENQLKRAQITHLQQALKYQPFVTPKLYTEGNEATPFGHKYESKLAFQVWNQEGQELLGSDSNEVTLSFQLNTGYSNEHIGDYAWRTFMLKDRDLNIWIKVAQRGDVRDELTEEIVISNLLPLGMMVPLLGFLIWLTVSRGLAPLHRLSNQITRRNPEHLKPLNTSDSPEEIKPVVAAINGLMEKLADALERERRFTADAAHELRTPLAGVRIHAQNLTQRPDPQMTSQAAEHIIGGVDRMTHAVEQLLTLSRLEHQSDPEFSHQDLATVVRQETAAIAPLALEKQLELSLSLEPEDSHFPLLANLSGLQILCRNLIDNAIRYTPTGGKIEVQLRRDKQQVMLVVTDTGPGIAAADRQRVFARFQRLGQQLIQGSGLGLAIVKEIASQHGARIILDDNYADQTGLKVMVMFPEYTATAPR